MHCRGVCQLPQLVAVILLGLVSGCGPAQVKLAWVASERPGHFQASYAAFTGCEIRTVRASQGETLFVAYDSTVKQGALAISVEGPAGEIVWAAFLDKDARGSVRLPVGQDGRHSIVIRGDSSAGSFDLSWYVGRSPPPTGKPRYAERC